jgi:CRP-like cAMP-binding protein
MNTETLSLLRAMVAKIDALYADGHTLEEACKSADATPRSYRRWTEILAYSRTEEPEVRSASIASILPELEAEFGLTKFAAGEVLFCLDDYADHMYVVASGTVQVVELDATIHAGEIVGEIGVFSEMHRRMASAVCLEDCELIRLPRERALELSCRKPTVGLAMTQIIADRLTRNAEQARAGLAQTCSNRVL